MKQKTQRTLVHVFIFVLCGSLALLAGVKFIDTVLTPAYYSMADECLPQGHDMSIQAGYVTAGKTTVNLQNTSNIQVQIDTSPEFDAVHDEIIKHENCHVQQIKEGRIHMCDSTSGKLDRYLIEVECYVKMYL